MLNRRVIRRPIGRGFVRKKPQYMWVRSTENPVTSPYKEQYLMWDNLYATELVFSSGATGGDISTSYKEYDIRAHRKMGNIGETLWLNLAQQGNTVLSGFSFTQSTLLRLP